VGFEGHRVLAMERPAGCRRIPPPPPEHCLVIQASKETRCSHRGSGFFSSYTVQ
jgi:hypothetical protein